MKESARTGRKQNKNAESTATADAQLREDQILEVAARLFKERGYRATTLQDVAEEIGVTRTAVYYYFTSKEDILYRIAEQANKHAAGVFEEAAKSDMPPDQKLRRMLRQYIEDVVRDGPRLWMLFSEGEQILPARQYRRLYRLFRQQDAVLQHVFREGVQSGVFANLNPKIAVFGIAGMLNWMSRWYDPKGEIDADTIAETFLHMLEHGYLAPAREPSN